MSPHKLWLLIAAAAAFGCAGAQPEQSAPPSPDEILQSYVEAGRVPGVVAMAADRNGRLYQGAFGNKSADGPPMQEDSIFRIASMTKPITAASVMQLVEQGKVSLDAGVDEYLPELAYPKVLEGYDDSGKPKLRDATRPPTIRELLSNTSGYAYPIWNDDIRRYEAESSLPGGREKFPLLPLATDPGTRWEYSPSTSILGNVVASVSGMTLEEYFRQNIFTPLGMNDTFFQVPEEKWDRTAFHVQRRPDGGFDAPEQERPSSPPQVTYYAGDGGLRSTAPDYIRFVRALLNGGELDGAHILQAATVDRMGRNQIGDFEAGEMTSVQPRLSNDVHLYPGVKDKFGFGFFLNAEPVPGARAEGTMMWAGLYNTYFWIDRKQGVGGVLMSQVLPFADTTVLEMLDRFEKAVYAGRPSEPRP